MMTLELEPADLDDLLRAACPSSRRRRSANASASNSPDGEDFGVLLLDLRKTKQIMYNLLSNAVKFSGIDGAVTFGVARTHGAESGLIAGDWPVHSFALPDGQFEDFIELNIRDAGIGISVEI